MESLILEDLILNNEDYTFEGDLTITSILSLSKCNLTVLGTLTIEKTAKVKIVIGNIIAETLILNGCFLDSLCNIFVKNLYAYSDINIKGNIEISENSLTRNIKCFNYSVDGNNTSHCIDIDQKVHIKGNNCSLDISGIYIFIEKDCSCTSLNAGTFICNGNFKATTIHISKSFECKNGFNVERGGLSFSV